MKIPLDKQNDRSALWRHDVLEGEISCRCLPPSIAIQTFGDFLGFNPHCHILVTGGCFYGARGMFRVAPPLELKKLETIFRHQALKMLLRKG